MAKMKAGPIVSDNGNFIIDAPFPEEQMKDPFTVSFSPYRYILSHAYWLVGIAVDSNQDAHRRRRGGVVLSYGQGGLLR